MKLNPKKILFGDSKPNRPVLVSVTPPSTGERTLLGVENLLQSIAVPEPFSLELAGDVDGVTLMARCLDEQVVRQQISTHYPQARIREVPPEDDPLRLDEGERAWSMTLRASGPDYLPLRTFRDDDLLDPGSDPLIALLGALSDLNEGERIVARMMLRSLGPDWSQAHLERAHKRPVQETRDSTYSNQVRHHQTDVTTMAVLGVVALVGLSGYLWVRAGETWKAVLLGVGVAAALTVAGWAWWRIKQARSRVYDPLLIKEKVARIAFDAELQVTAVLPQGGTAERAKGLLASVAAAYRHYDHPAGRSSRWEGSGPSPSPAPPYTPPVPACSGDAASWECARRPPCGTRREPTTRPLSLLGQARRRSSRLHTARREALRSATPPPASPGRSASPRTCSGVTTSTWPGHAWASPPSCTTSSPTR